VAVERQRVAKSRLSIDNQRDGIRGAVGAAGSWIVDQQS